MIASVPKTEEIDEPKLINQKHIFNVVPYAISKRRGD
jgi:hypothetical protein